MQWNWLIFGLGAVGGAAPEIIRLYALKNTPNQFTWSTFYLIVSLLFVGLAGLVAVILPTVTLWGAFYAGVAMPVIVSAIAKKGLSGDGGGDTKAYAGNAAGAPAASIHSFFRAL